MSEIALVNTTGHYPIDRMLRGMIGVLERVFPDRIRGYYLTGSYNDGSAVSTSDLDVFVLFKAQPTPAEATLVQALGDECSWLSSVRLDLYPNGENALSWFAGVLVKDASLFLYGEDTRQQMVRTPLELFVQGVAYGCGYLLSEVYQTETLIYPLGYPDPEDEFYGYYAEEVVLPTGDRYYSGKKFVTNAICSPATGLISLRAPRYIPTKHACIAAYRTAIGDEWTPLVETAYDRAKMTWAYKLPTIRSDRALLRTLCAQTPALANTFLLTLKPYLLAELQHPDPAHRYAALQLLERVVYPGDEVLTFLGTLPDTQDPLFAQAVVTTIATLRKASTAPPLTQRSARTEATE